MPPSAPQLQTNTPHPHPGLYATPEEPFATVESRKSRVGTQEKDKSRKLSCKECRRLKLKCDRIFPCQSCVKRGCGSLCPEGALTSGRGSRFILANTEQLHEKITVLSDRVRDLEEALQALQSTCSNQPHPLLAPELLRIKTSQDLYMPPNPNPISGPSGEDMAPSTGVLSLSQPPYAPITSAGPESRAGPPDVPPDILKLSSTFPFPWCVDLSIRRRIRDALPPRHEAEAVCEQARTNALWQYHLDASETFSQTLLHHCYSSPIEELSPRRLALLLMILSIGSLVDLRRPLGSLYGEAYHHLARAAVCEIPLMEEPDFDVLHVLFFMIWWHLTFSDNKKAVGYAWNLMGFTAKLAQGLGLHRDNPRLKGIPEEDEKRRAVFWELLNLDARMSLSLGRPPSICLRHVDTKPPSFGGPGACVPREEVVYHEWKNAFFIHCLTPVLDAVVSVDPPNYSAIVALDHRVREFQVPEILIQRGVVDPGASMVISGGSAKREEPRFGMQRALVTTSRDIELSDAETTALLQLHRRFFTDAISRTSSADAPYAPSVLATCLSAASLIRSVEALFDQEQELSVRILSFWFNVHSAAATLALFVTRTPEAPFAPEAQKHLERACTLFARAALVLPLCRGLLVRVSILSSSLAPTSIKQHVAEKLADKSRLALKQFQSADALLGMQGGASTSADSYHALAVIPESFEGAHPDLRRYAAVRSSAIASIMPPAQQEEAHGQDAYLPDLYKYNAFVELHTPFVPNPPRVNAKDEFNFDHGALGALCEETGYMAWF
ncbi:hypothetical protein H0H81_003530 [Sphagnurus paluster]|uniref:Zn(2)-C6 fungal-type domain-containing protein n=1 Tax=Sphagnurus paluster TaxID=117069 RepID=A0A9P7KK71_9AGAR|nr:hypothetical protein H0H81_003530 [Sphagnurus paluster]